MVMRGTSLALGIPVGGHNGSKLNQQSALMLTSPCLVKLIFKDRGHPQLQMPEEQRMYPRCDGEIDDLVAINKPDIPASLNMFLCLRFMLISAFESPFSSPPPPPFQVMGMASRRNLNAFHLTFQQLDKCLSSRGKSIQPEVEEVSVCINSPSVCSGEVRGTTE